MKALELSLRNYRVFEEVDLELPAQVIGIFGENGSGKSTLMESIAVALFGVDAARTKKQQIRTAGVLTECEVRLVFEHGGLHYEVRRALKGRGHAPEAELYGGGLLLASGTTDVDAEVRRLLHMDLPVFRASVYAEQKQLDAFSDLAAGKRKEMVRRLLGVLPVDGALEAARREARAASAGAEQLAGVVADIAALEAELKEVKEATAEATATAGAAAEELTVAGARATSARGAFETLDAARERAEKLKVEIDAAVSERDRLVVDRDHRDARIAALTTDLEAEPSLRAELGELGGVEELLRVAERWADAAAKHSAVQTELEALPLTDEEAANDALDEARLALTAALENLTRATSERDRLTADLERSEDRVDRAHDADPAQPCPTCGQPLGDAFSSYLQHLRADAAQMKKALNSSTKAARDAEAARTESEKRLAAAQAVAEAARKRSGRRAALVERMTELSAEATRLAATFDGETPDIDALRSGAEQVKRLHARLAELGVERKRLTEAEQDLAKLQSRLRTLDGKIGQLAQAAEELSFDAGEHARLRSERERSDLALEVARTTERKASDTAAKLQASFGEIAGRLSEARDTERRVGDLRSDARYLDRTALLLDGFRDHLVARVGPELSREAEALFRELTNHEYDDLRIDDGTLAIQIADGDSYFPVERFSGSEADLANLALRVAISIHLSRVSGADLGMLVLDEVLGSLDQERKDLMVRTMGRLASSFHQLFVVTHAEQVKDQFPAAIAVSKSGRRRATAVLV